MRFLLCAVLFAATFASLSPAQDEGGGGGGISLEPANGEINPRDTITVSFPGPMVEPAVIDAPNRPAPIEFTPAIKGIWLWKSQTEGSFQIDGGIVPGTKYRPRLVSGLRDLRGAPVTSLPAAEYESRAFKASTEFEPRKRLRGKPQVLVEFTYPVELSDAAEKIYFQDRDSFARLGAEIGLNPNDRNTADENEATKLRVSPRDPLPPGRTYDLILDGVRTQAGGGALPYLQRFPLGTTVPLAVEWLGAFNAPREQPAIRAQFTEELVPETVNASTVKVEPAVPKLKIRSSLSALVIEGDFDQTVRYKVTLGTGIRDISGYSLAAESRWGATFQPKPGAVFFPGALVHQRARSGLNFSFIQINTGELKWRLAELPVEKLAEVEKRLREFTEARVDPLTKEPMKDPKTGFDLGRETEVFVDAFGLREVANGSFPASANANEESLRTIQWTPGGGAKPLGGFYLLEVTGPLRGADAAKLAGHRSIVCFSDAILTQKRTGDKIILRATRMRDGTPIADAKIKLVNRNHFLLASATTDGAGLATFATSALKKFDDKEKGRLFLAETSEGYAIQPFDSTAFNPDYSSPRNAGRTLRAVQFTDRNLYRPGHVMKLKGLARYADPLGEIREIPVGAQVRWAVTKEYANEVVAQGETSVSAEGGWEGEWTIPNEIKLGNYSVSASIGGVSAGRSVSIKIQEYKAPLFLVTAEPETMPVPTTKSTVKVSSAYFSGQPNGGAKVRWKALWTRNDYDGEGSFMKTDNRSEKPEPEDDSATVEGEAKLDVEGRVTLTCEAPKTLVGTRYSVGWTVFVTSLDGQTIQPNNIDSVSVMLRPVGLGVKVEEGERATPQRLVRVSVDAFDIEGKSTATAVRPEVEIFHITTKVAKEKVAPFVFRYRNTPQFNSLSKVAIAVPGKVEIPMTKSGKYVAVVSAPDLRRVSASEIFSGDTEDEVPVADDTSLEVREQKSKLEVVWEDSNRTSVVGVKSPLLIRTPITGRAWVTVEAEGQVIDSFDVPVTGNNARFDLPMRPEFAPNSYVAVYLVKPGGEKDLPAERFGTLNLKVKRPDWELDITPTFDNAVVRPAELVSGSVVVLSDKRPVADADLTLFAVDDAVLELGRWAAPDVKEQMRPTRQHGVSTFMALNEFVSGINPRSQFQKGFIIGGGGQDDAGFVRKDFKALAYWKTGVRTDGAGKATFQFTAPDNLSRFRLVVVGQTKAHQFGVGQATVEIAKPLIVEPALPRFLRQGDEVELRAVARLGSEPSKPGKVTVKIVPDSQLTLTGPATLTAEVSKGNPTAFRFRAKVSPDATSAQIRLEGASEGIASQTDAVQLTLPVHPPVVPRKEAASGTLAAGATSFPLGEKLPADWRKPGAKGTVEAVVSTSPHLPRLLALEALLDYPHGCFEQVTSKALTHTLVAELLRTIPPGLGERRDSRAAVESVLRLYEKHLLYGGGLPYWPSTGDERSGTGNPFVTTYALWAVQQAATAGYKVPQGVEENLSGAVVKIAENKAQPAYLRAFALFVMANYATSTLELDDYLSVYRDREKLSDEGRALLALALHTRKAATKERDQLVRELGELNVKERAFDPNTFSSDNRAFATAFAALDEIKPPTWTKEKREAALKRLTAILDDAPGHSTQENLWALYAFRGVVRADAKGAPIAKLRPPRTRAAFPVLSPDSTSALWPGRDLANPAPIPLQDMVPLAATPLSYLLQATYTPPPGLADNDRRDRGFRVERVVKNITDPARDGSAKAPYRLNDRLLVTYRIVAAKQGYYVALEDELPAGVENISPDLAMFADTLGVKPEEGGRFCELSFVERRDQKTTLYFDRLPSGSSSYSVLLRVSSPGSFRWPSAVVTPMYDPRRSGQTAASEVTVGE